MDISGKYSFWLWHFVGVFCPAMEKYGKNFVRQWTFMEIILITSASMSSRHFVRVPTSSYPHCLMMSQESGNGWLLQS